MQAVYPWASHLRSLPHDPQSFVDSAQVSIVIVLYVLIIRNFPGSVCIWISVMSDKQKSIWVQESVDIFLFTSMMVLFFSGLVYCYLGYTVVIR